MWCVQRENAWTGVREDVGGSRSRRVNGKKIYFKRKNSGKKSPFFVILNSENRIFYLTDFRIFKSVLENPVI